MDSVTDPFTSVGLCTQISLAPVSMVLCVWTPLHLWGQSCCAKDYWQCNKCWTNYPLESKKARNIREKVVEGSYLLSWLSKHTFEHSCISD